MYIDNVIYFPGVIPPEFDAYDKCDVLIAPKNHNDAF